jgi:hypothetical protein
MVPIRPRILPAVNAPMPHSSVRVVPEALTGGLDVGGGLGDAPVQLAYLGDQVHGEAAQGLAGGIAGTDPAKELGGPLGREVTLRTGRDEVGEHDMEAVDGLGAGFDQVVAVVDDRA